MNEWLAQLDINSIIIGLFAGLLVGLIAAFSLARSARRKGAESESARLLPANTELEDSLKVREEELAEIQRSLAIAETRLEEQQQHHKAEKTSLQ
jgi:hypothetical protein